MRNLLSKREYSRSSSYAGVSGNAVNRNTTVSGNATQSLDYTISPSDNVTIVAGGLSANITISVNDDGLYETDETVVVTMGTPVNAGISFVCLKRDGETTTRKIVLAK